MMSENALVALVFLLSILAMVLVAAIVLGFEVWYQIRRNNAEKAWTGHLGALRDVEYQM